MVAARRAVAAEKLGRRGAEEVGERLKPGEPRARAALFPIADRGDGNAEPAGEVGLAEPPVTAQPSQTVAEHLIGYGHVRVCGDHGGATFPTLDATFSKVKRGSAFNISPIGARLKCTVLV